MELLQSEWQYVKSEANQLQASRPRFFRNSGNIPSTPAAFFALVTASPLSTSALVYWEKMGLLQLDCLVACDSSFLTSRWASLVVGTFELHSNRAATSFAVTLGGWYWVGAEEEPRCLTRFQAFLLEWVRSSSCTASIHRCRLPLFSESSRHVATSGSPDALNF